MACQQLAGDQQSQIQVSVVSKPEPCVATRQGGGLTVQLVDRQVVDHLLGLGTPNSVLPRASIGVY